jgi:hypothetical protein
MGAVLVVIGAFGLLRDGMNGIKSHRSYYRWTIVLGAVLTAIASHRRED